MIREIVLGDKRNRNKFESVGDIRHVDFIGKMVTEAYSSIYTFDEMEIKSYVSTNKGIKGFRGKVSTSCLFWDIDSDGDLDAAVDATRILYNRLIEELFVPSDIKVFFSGNKGMHIYAFSSAFRTLGMSTKVPVLTRAIALDLAKGIPHVDTTVYNTTRIFRIPNSVHGATGKFKVDITDIFQFASEEEILNVANDQVDVNWGEVTESKSKKLQTILNDAVLNYNSLDHKTGEGKLEYADVIKIIEEGAEDGKRNDSLARLTGLFHNAGLGVEITGSLIEMVNQRSKNPIDERELQTIIGSITSYPVNQRNDAEYTDVENISTFGSAGRAYVAIAQRAFEQGHGYGEMFKHLNDPMGMVIPGDVIGIVANSGVGKSSLAMLMARESVIVAKEYALVASLEMSKEGMFFRATSMHLINSEGFMTPREIANVLINTPELISEVEREWERVFILDNASCVEQIEQHYIMLKAQLENEGKKLTTLVIDYGQMLDNTDTNDKEKKVSRGLKRMAKRLNTKLYLLLQLNKLFVDPYNEPTRTHIEGSGGWYQTMDYCLMFWKSKAYSHIIHGKIEKNRWAKDDTRFDIEKHGLKFHTIDETPEPVTEEECMQDSQYRKRRKKAEE